MYIFLYVVFVLLGLFIGGGLGGLGGALLGGMLGFFVMFIRRPQASDKLEELEREVRYLRGAMSELSERVDALSSISSSTSPPINVTEEVRADVAEEPISPPPTIEEKSPSTFETAEASLPPFAPEPVAPDVFVPPPAPAQTAIEMPPLPAFDFLERAKNWLFGGNTVVRVGIVVLFFGLAFLVKFAAENAVLPVEARYAGVGLAALAALTVGWRLRERRPEYSMALQGLGVAALYLVIFAAFRLHDLLPGGLTLALLVATCVLSAALAILQDAQSMAVIGICGGFLAPVLASTGGGSHVALFSYYALLNAGVFGIAWFKAWRPLNVLGFLFTFGIGSLWGARNYRDEIFSTTEPFLILFFFLYLVVSLLYAGRRKAQLSNYAVDVAGERIDYVDGTLVFGTPLAAFGLQYLMVKDMAFGSAFSALGLGLIYLPLASVLYHRRQENFRLLVESFLALGVIFASLAIPLGLDAKWTSAAWAAEGAGMFWVGIRQRRPVARAFALLLEFGSGVSLLITLHPASQTNLLGLVPMLDGSFLGPLFVGLAGLSSAELIRRNPQAVTDMDVALEATVRTGGLVFLNLSFPMFLDQTWTSLALALSGTLILWVGASRNPLETLAFGALLQLLGGSAFRNTVPHSADVPLLNLFWLGSALIAGCGFVSGWRLSRLAGFVQMSIIGLGWGLLWWWAAGYSEIHRYLLPEYHLAAEIGLSILTASLLLLAGHLSRWRQAEVASALLAAVLLFGAMDALLFKPHPGADAGWLAWPVAATLLMVMLRRLEAAAVSQQWLHVGHGFALVLTTSLLTAECWWQFGQLGDPGSAWPVLGWASAPLAAVPLINNEALRRRWPLAPFAEGYRVASVVVVTGLWLWVFVANWVSDGSAAPLVYLPLANPIDLATAGALLAILGWQGRWLQDAEHARMLRILLAATAFYWLNGLLLRTLHHWGDVPFDFDAMMRSTLVQASLSLFWAAIALALMLFATRQMRRILWLVGGGLMGAVVVKLFLVDLSRAGTVERIVSFIGVGVLLLVIGYFSPVPPKREETA